MAQSNPYVVLNNKWHKVDSRDETKLACGVAKPSKSETGSESSKICEGCKSAFPTV